ncbi:MAG TPA: sulfatase-like hydrolase/transferase [Hyphomicrobiaceae bacterium]|nr:sulfatase-like hydrolase/transferase [Hyphomicrobiaceae bacterium]
MAPLRPMSRRRFVQTTAASSLALAGMSVGRPTSAQRPKPNIVFILADDLGYADVSCYGQRDYTTPNIDRLALEGLRFTQGYSNSPDCSATRVALMTGRYQARLPVGLEEPMSPLSPKDVGLPPNHPTLPSLLKKAGYGTTLVGKWHLGYLPDFGPLKSGYDHFFGIIGCCADYFNHGAAAPQSYPLPIPGLASQLYEQDVPVERHGYMTNLLGDRAVQTVESYGKSKEPFLLSLHFTAPHWPWEGPDDEAESKRIRSIIHRDGGSQKTYAAMVQSLDINVGRVLQALDASGLASNTIVVFTSDNGGERFSNVWPFSGMKQELLEGGLRIPVIARWPGHFAPGSISNQVMITMDWMPTLLAAAGTAPDVAYPADGEDIEPITTGRALPHPRKLYWRYKAGSQRAMREGNWKYLRIASNEFLFDVMQDPRERANLRDREQDVFDRMKTDWEAWNGSMLEERSRPASYFHPGNVLADRYGVTNPPPTPPSGSPKN